MSAPDLTRQLIAGGGAAAVFLGLYFGLRLQVAPAGVLASLTLVGLMLLIPRRPPPEAVMLSDGVSAADLAAAVAALSQAAARLRTAALRAPEEAQPALARMSELLGRIEAHHRADPRDLRHTRRFLRSELPRLVDVVETFVDLSERADQANAPRLAALSARVRAFAPALEKIEQACLDNDFLRLDVETEVLGDQLDAR